MVEEKCDNCWRLHVIIANQKKKIEDAHSELLKIYHCADISATNQLKINEAIKILRK